RRPDVQRANELGTLVELPWSAREAIVDLVDELRKRVGEVRVDSGMPPWSIRIDHHVATWMSLFCNLIALDEFGALQPEFSRGDALAGDVWLLQPVTPRRTYFSAVESLGLGYFGDLPPNWVDVPGRRVMVCLERELVEPDARLAFLRSATWL